MTKPTADQFDIVLNSAQAIRDAMRATAHETGVTHE